MIQWKNKSFCARRVGHVLRRRQARLTLLLVAVFCAGSLHLSVRGEETRRSNSLRSVKGAGTPRAMLGDCSVGQGNPDCNSNGIADECDIRNCVGAPACDDCNLNGVPDECDISSFASFDFDFNGVPDECIFYDNGGFGGNWSSAGNWFGDQVPNNLDFINDESVTIDTFGVNLDLTVQVDTLRLLGGSTLTVAGADGQDFDVAKTGGILISSDAGALSRLVAGNGRLVKAVDGTMHVGSGGVYEGFYPVGSSAAGTTAGPSARLDVGNILVDSRCGEPVAGEVILSGQMVTNVFGNVVLDATRDCVVCAMCALGNAAGQGVIAGGETPPIIRVKGSAILRVAGNVMILGPAQFVQQSTSPIEVAGDFIIQSPCPECFDFSGGIVVKPFNTSAVAAVVANLPHVIEVAGRDVGPVNDGFNANFAIGTLEVYNGETANFVDLFSNTGSTTPEALYVDTLILRDAATITLSNCRVYYNNLIDEGAFIEHIGSGALMPVANLAAIPTVSVWGVVVMFLAMMTAGTVVIRARRYAVQIDNGSIR
ncbi:MAG: hypothetical protein AAB385_08085 [Planctomycetota bacterium]